jgi:hypothetical protein
VHLAHRTTAAWPVALWGDGPTAWDGGPTYTSGGAGGGMLADGLGAEVEARVHGVLVRQARRLRVARWAAGILRIRGPPLPADRGERVWTPSRTRLARWLRRDGMDRQTADEVAGRVWAAGLRDGRGRRVLGVVAERVPAVRASGLWPEVRDHEIRHLDGAGRTAEEHARDSAELIAAIEAAS